MDAIEVLRQQALAQPNARILAAKREYHDALLDIRALAGFTRLTNGHSKSLRHHKAMQSLFVAWYNFGRKHEALGKQTPAMESGLSDHIWSIKKLIERSA